MLRVESMDSQTEEVVDFIDLTDNADIERVIEAGRVLRAKKEAEMGGLAVESALEIKLEETTV